jgi:dolichyl-phosphate beta-glucosyltransferase
MTEAVTVVIPAYNEARRIGETLRRVTAYLAGRGAPFEVLVVDDGSSDATRQVVLGFEAQGVGLVVVGTNRGKGYAVRMGMLQARHPLVLMCDADLSTPIEELDVLAGFPEDVVIGSRDLPGARITVPQPWYRRLCGRAFRHVADALVHHGLQDTQCGFKLFRRPAARAIFERQTLDRFCFDVEALCIARALGLTIREHPVAWDDTRHSTVRLLPDGGQMLRDLLTIRRNLARGVYR